MSPLMLTGGALVGLAADEPAAVDLVEDDAAGFGAAAGFLDALGDDGAVDAVDSGQFDLGGGVAADAGLFLHVGGELGFGEVLLGGRAQLRVGVGDTADFEAVEEVVGGRDGGL